LKGWQSGLSDRTPVEQAGGPEFEPQYHTHKKKVEKVEFNNTSKRLFTMTK
jgi:hypothetical protein